MPFYKKNNQILLIFYFAILILVFLFYKDYGVHIEEKFHRMNGLYWLNYISQTFNFEKIFLVTSEKMNLVDDYTLNKIENYKNYGIIFDVPLALFEVIFNIKKIETIYHLKHILSFLIFLFSSWFFYKILIKRFKTFFLSLLGTALFLSSPRIFGDSFLYKDILYLSFFTITIYFFLETVESFKIKNLIYFAVFSAISFNLKPFGIFIPFVFFFILLIKNFYTKDIYKYLKSYFLYLIFFLILIIFFSPNLWSNTLSNFIDIFSTLKKEGIITFKILFNNRYVTNQNVPLTYLITWILISTPVIILTFFILGYITCTKRVLGRFFKINNASIYNDLWRSKYEQKDFIIFFLMTFYFFTFVVLDAPLHNGWRLAYFFNIFIVYFMVYQINNLLLLFNKKKLQKNSIVVLTILAVLYNVVFLIKYHPYQSYYFNELLSDKKKILFEVDYYGLAAKELFLKLAENNKGKSINIGVASNTPIHRGLEGIDENLRKKFKIVGQNYALADYIFKNNISEVDHRLNKKYDVPENFDILYVRRVNGLKIYEIYKNNNLK